MSQKKLPPIKQLAYAAGMMGWSVLINLIGVILVYLYLPPSSSGLPALITQVTFLGIFNVVALITSGGRLLDALYDPFIAQVSDRSENPKGRRIPIMKLAILPSVIFCFLVFYPLKQYESGTNIAWLTLMLAGFYFSSTSYIIPYNALLPELAPTAEDKVRLSSWQSFGYVAGIGISSNTFNLTEWIQAQYALEHKIHALQMAIACMCALAGLAMLITVLAIDEREYISTKPSSISLYKALGQTLKNRNFIFFIVADFSYFLAVTIITSGLIYFVTVLLQLPESIGNKLMITMVLISFVFYPLVNYLARKIGKKPLVLFSFVILALVFIGIYFLGKFPADNELQIFALISVAAIPLAALNILPNAILSEIIEKDGIETGENKEAIYFAVRYFFVKIAQTIGIALFATLLICGKDVGNDLGIRLNGLFGCVMCLIAAMTFTRFREVRNPRR